MLFQRIAVILLALQPWLTCLLLAARCAAVLASWLFAEAPSMPPTATSAADAAAGADAPEPLANGVEAMDLDAAPANSGDAEVAELRMRMEAFLQDVVTGIEVRGRCWLGLG